MRTVLRVAPALGPPTQRLLWRAVYESASTGRRSERAAVMNYGFAPLEASAEAWPPRDRFGLQLYSKVAGAVKLADTDVLEVGCGRGAGAAFVLERFAPRSVTGVDLAGRAIAFGRSRHARPGLELRTGDAERLPFPPGRFGAVLSVESSHCYPDPERFFSEVHRVLTPGGVFLLADLRRTAVAAEASSFGIGDLPELRAQLARTGFRALEEEDITAGVLLALRLNTANVRERIERRVPRLLRGPALAFAAVEGSAMYRGFADGELAYTRFALVRE